MKRPFPHLEHRTQPLLPLNQFIFRMVRSGSLAFALIILSLFIGMAGYHIFEGLGWIDAFLNASMLLGGMGPINSPITLSGKIFAGLYALYCGLAVILATGVILAPVAHRILHRFHMETGK